MHKHTGEVEVWLHSIPIPHLYTRVAHSHTGLLSPTHDSSPTCYLIKTHCPSLSLQETSLSTCVSTVTISTDFPLTHAINRGHCNCVYLTVVTTQNYERPQVLICSYRLWTAWEVCGAIYWYKEANQSPRNENKPQGKPSLMVSMMGDHGR